MKEDNVLKQITSPLRYPGGKGLLTDYFVDLMSKNDLYGCRYFEPYAGGAGVALGLLSKGAASEIFLNDADYHIYCFWKAIVSHNQEFIDRLDSVDASVQEWGKQKDIYENPKKHTLCEVAFSTFFLNRCNRSGIIAGAGPIGGYEQKGEWRLNARFNKSVLAARIMAIGNFKKQISIQNMDAIDFLKNFLPRGNERKNVFVYCDPPYVSAGNKLYLNFYQNNDHKELSQYLLSQNGLKWVVSYDDNPLIRSLYGSSQKWIFSLGYSLQASRKGRELLIAPEYIQLPGKSAIKTNRWNLIRKLNVSEKPTEVLV